MILSAITAVVGVFAAGYGWVILARLARASDIVQALHTGPDGDAQSTDTRPALRLVERAGQAEALRTGEPVPRPQVLTAAGWVDVELCARARHLMPAGDTWRVDPADFARRFDAGLARYLDGERTVAAGRYTGANQRSDAGASGDDFTGAQRLAA